MSDRKVAIVCDWLTGIGGAERVVLELHKLYPEAPIYTSQYDKKKISWFADALVQTTWLQKFPAGLKKFLPVFRILAFKGIPLSDYSLIISSAGAEAKAVKKSPGTIHISYIHAPTHYYWSRYDSYLKNPGFGIFDPLARISLRVLVGPLRRADYKAAQGPDFLIANSTHTKEEIKKYYNRDSIVIHPPVDTKRFANSNTKRSGYVITGRQTPYKKIDLAVAACTKLGVELAVIGDGPERQKLKKMAGPTITFLGETEEQEVVNRVKSAKAFIFPGLDDFGISSVEALAAGTPVIAFKAGGALDYVVEGETGIFFDSQDVESLCDAIQKFERLDFDNKKVAKHAEQFSIEQFHTSITEFVKSKTAL